jgi:hypothetical protein
MATQTYRRLEDKIMKLILAVVTFSISAAYAHPGIGIVVDSRGNVFYTDLQQVWRLAPDGKLEVAVPGVHAHELCLDASDNLYGEHLWYEGDRTGFDPHSPSLGRWRSDNRRVPVSRCSLDGGVARGCSPPD